MLLVVVSLLSEHNELLLLPSLLLFRFRCFGLVPVYIGLDGFPRRGGIDEVVRFEEGLSFPSLTISFSSTFTGLISRYGDEWST